MNGKTLSQDAPCAFGDRPIVLKDSAGGFNAPAKPEPKLTEEQASLQAGTPPNAKPSAKVAGTGWKPSNAVDEAKAKEEKEREA